MPRFNAAQVWNQPMNITFGGSRRRLVTASGRIGVEFVAKLFPSSGRPITVSGRIRRSSSTISANVSGLTLIGGSGYRLQTYWKFQYDLDIGELSGLSRIRGAREFAGFKIAGLSNIIQSFDIVPPQRPRQPYSAVFRNMRGDNRPRGAAAWEWGFNHNRSVRSRQSGPSIVTTTVANLPVSFRGSLTAEVSTAIGAEMGWDLGPSVTGNVSAGVAAGASVDLELRRSLDMRLIGNIDLITER